VEASLYADRDVNEILVDADVRWDPDSLLEQYDLLSLAQTALFDATEVRIRSNDPKRLVSAVKRLRLMYEVETTPRAENWSSPGRTRCSRTRRYATAFARLLRTVAKSAEWELSATIDDRGRERTMRLSDGDVTVPGVEPVAEPDFDSGVEADFAGRFRGGSTSTGPWCASRKPSKPETG